MTSTSLSSAIKTISGFALKPPALGDRPKAPIRINRAFTGKPAAKPTAFKPQTEGEPQKGLPASTGSIVARNVKLDTWLKEVGDKPGYTEAREYLLTGPPYKGKSNFRAKEQLKDNGARWIPNPLKQKGAKDGVAGGWWSALNERDVRTFMELTYLEPDKHLGYHLITGGSLSRGFVPGGLRKSWKPLGVPEESANNVLKLISQFDAHVYDFERRQAEERAAVPSKKQAAERAVMMNVTPDTLDEIERLRAEYGIDWNETLAAQSRAVGGLGPRSNLSDAFLVLRVLNFKIMTRDDVLSGQWVKERAVKRHRIAGGASSSTTYEPIDYRKQKMTGYERFGSCSGCFMFGKGPRMIPLPNVGEWERLSEELKQRDMANIKPLPDGFVIGAACTTFCTSCALEVFDQFIDCGCDQTWDQCLKCRSLRCEKQPCACGEEDAGAWKRAQNTAHRIYHDCMRAAEALVLSDGGVAGSEPFTVE